MLGKEFGEKFLDAPPNSTHSNGKVGLLSQTEYVHFETRLQKIISRVRMSGLASVSFFDLCSPLDSQRHNRRALHAGLAFAASPQVLAAR